MGLGLNCLSTDTLRHPIWSNFNKAVKKLLPIIYLKLQKFQFIKKGVNMNKFNKMLDDNMFLENHFLKKQHFGCMHYFYGNALNF